MLWFCRLPVQRHCILVCNSPPYNLPSQEGVRYVGYMADQLASMMAKVCTFNMCTCTWMNLLCNIFTINIIKQSYFSITFVAVKNYRSTLISFVFPIDNVLCGFHFQRGIHLSIISPRKIPALQKLYEEVCIAWSK